MRNRYVVGLVALAAALVALIGCSSGANQAASGPGPETEQAAAADQPETNGCAVEPAQVWVEEGELATAVIDCGGSDVSVDGPSGIVISGDELSWTPALDQAGNHEVTVAAGGSSGTWLVGVADAFDAPGNSPVADPALITHEFGLEVLHLFPEAHLSDEDVDAILVHGGRSYQAEVSVRGATSLQHPKIGLDVKVDEGLSTPDPAFDGVRELTLVAGFDDNSAIRNRLAQQLWSDMSADHLGVSHASVVVYLDGRYMGVYTLVEDVGPEYLERNGLDTDAQLFKADDGRANFRLDDDPAPTAGFEKKNGEPETGLRSMDAIGRFVEFVVLADDATFVNELDTWVELEDVVDWFVFVDFIAASDSTGKNAFWYQPDPESPFRYIPWDFNHSFGQDWGTFRVAADSDLVSLHVGFNGLFDRISDEPELWSALLVRYGDLLDDEFSPPNLTQMVDALVDDLDRNLERDERRWGAEYADYPGWSARTDVETGADEVDYIREWIAARHEYVTAALQSEAADS